MAQTAYRMWYNVRNGHLKAAVEKLAGMNTRRRRLRDALRPWKLIGWWVLIPLLPMMLGVYFLIYGVWQLLALMLYFIAAYYMAVTLLLGATNALRWWHLRRLRRHHFGAAIMWEVDAGWSELQAALKEYDIDLMAFVDDARIEEQLTEYLLASRHVRLRLIQEPHRPKPTHPDMIKLAEFARQFAARIDAALWQG